MQEIIRMLDLYADDEMVVTLLGRPGVGKTILALYLHLISKRANRKMVSVNCATVPEYLAESELFGHEKGSYTDAYFDRRGYFQQADGSTLFLDEISLTPLCVQPKLLRAIETGWIKPVGSEKEIHVDCRVVTATNADLEELVAKGQFREDLYWRIFDIPIYVPPLRERKEDIVILMNIIVHRYCEKKGLPFPQIDRDAFRALLSYDWPGNIRQLETVLQRATRECKGAIITIRLIEILLKHHEESKKNLKEKLALVEKQEMVGAIIASDLDSEAAESIEYSPGKFKSKKRDYGIYSRSIRKTFKG